jgi:hypothetical protein
MSAPAEEGAMDAGVEQKSPLACFDRALLLRVVGAGLGVMLLALIVRLLKLERGSAARIGFGLAEVALMAYAIAISVGAIRRLDELQYRIQLEAIAFAFACTGILMTGWGLMTKAGLPPVSWGPETWLVMVLLWAIGLWRLRGRYR